MNDIDLNAAKLLLLYDKITRFGNRDKEEHHLNGIAVSSDFDGYTLFLHDSDVYVTLYFHNSFAISCDDNKSLAIFKVKVMQILDQY